MFEKPVHLQTTSSASLSCSVLNFLHTSKTKQIKATLSHICGNYFMDKRKTQNHCCTDRYYEYFLSQDIISYSSSPV